MARGLGLLLGFMAAFWGVFMTGAWMVAEIYLPWVQAISAGAENVLLVEFLTWLVVLILMALLLIAFKYLLHAIFWWEMAKTQRQPP